MSDSFTPEMTVVALREEVERLNRELARGASIDIVNHEQWLAVNAELEQTKSALQELHLVHTRDIAQLCADGAALRSQLSTTTRELAEVRASPRGVAQGKAMTDLDILTESELTTLEQSSGDDCCMASVRCVVRELRAARLVVAAAEALASRRGALDDARSIVFEEHCASRDDMPYQALLAVDAAVVLVHQLAALDHHPTGGSDEAE